MNEERREKAVSGFEKAIMVAGAENYEEGMKQATKFLRFALDGAESIQTKDGLRTVLDQLQPMSRSEERLALFMINQLPQLIRIGLKIASKKATKTLPSLPGGRPSRTNAPKAQEVVDWINDLHRKGTTFKAAKERASLKFELSSRTIERLWSNRASIPQDEPTIDDVLSFISKGE